MRRRLLKNACMDLHEMLHVDSRDGKNHDFFKKIENIEKIENIGYFRYISDFFDIYPIHI